MFLLRVSITFAAAITLSACGTYTPDIQEFWGTPGDATRKVNKISSQVVCELRRAVQQVFVDNETPPTLVSAPGHPAPRPRDLSWFEQWGAQVTLNLNIIESSNLTPGASFNKVLRNAITVFPDGNVTTPQFLSTSLGLTGSTTATRTDKLNMFFTVRELKYGMPSIDLPCTTTPTRGDLFVQSDLKILDWLRAALLPYDTSIINYDNNTSPQNAITHEVKFQIDTDGSVTPTWKLVRFTANNSNKFFGASRKRSQDLTITFGPIQGSKTQKQAPRRLSTNRLQLATPAENAHLATQIGLAVSESLKGP